MTAPTRTRTRPRVVEPVTAPASVPTQQPARRRSAAAERAYQRRAERVGRITGVRPEQPQQQSSGAAGRASFVALIIGVLTAGVILTLWLSTQAVADSYRLDQAKRSAGELSERAEQLRREVAQQDSATALAERAKQLGMIPAVDPARLLVRPDGSTRVVGDAKPAKPVPPPAPTPTQQPPQQQQQQQQPVRPGGN